MLTKKEVQLLRAIQHEIREEPNRFAMGIISIRLVPGSKLGNLDHFINEWNGWNKYEQEQLVPACGTVGCLLGWGQILSKRLFNEDSPKELLCPLYSVENWPESYQGRYSNAKTPKERVDIACEVVDLFIEKGGTFYNV